MTSDYDNWNHALAERFLQGRRDQPLYLFTDAGVIEEISPGLGVQAAEAVATFASAVRETLLSHKEPFRRWALESSQAPHRSDPPRHFAVLCFLVLVAVERDSTHFKYYPDLNRSLGRQGDSAPPGFEQHVPAMFRHFNAWLEGPGREHGTPTAAPHPHYPNVGWPLSQAIVRPPDRALMVKLFSSAGLSPHAGLTGASLRARVLPRLKVAADTPARGRLIKLEAEHPQVLEDALAREYAAWDGSSVLVVGPRRVHLRLCFDETYGDWWFSAPMVAGTVGHSFHVGSEVGVVPPTKGLEAAPEDIWQLVGAGDVGGITDGPLLTSRGSARRWLSTDIRVGGWGETWLRDPDQDQLLLVPEGSADAAAPPSGVESHEDSPIGFRLLRVPRGVLFKDEAVRSAPVLPLLEGGLVLHAPTRTYLLAANGAPEVLHVGERLTVNGVEVSTIQGNADLAAYLVVEGVNAVVADGQQWKVRMLRQLESGPVMSSHDPWSSLPQCPRVRIPGSHATVWFLSEAGEVEQRAVRPSSWLGELDLMDNEVDVTGLVKSIAIKADFVIGASYMGRPWVERVPAGLASLDREQPKRPANSSEARKLITSLLVGYGPDERHQDAGWKRAFAALMRRVHR